MKSKIDEKYCFSTEILIGNDSFTLYGVNSKHQTNKCLIFIPGLNGNGAMINYWNYPEIITDWNLFSFDPRAQGDNKCTPSRRYKKYLNDVHKIVECVKEKYNMKEIILLGESWGASLCTLYAKNYNDVNGYFFWNMPYSVIDVSDEKGWAKFKKSFKMIITFLTNINTYDEAKFIEQLTNDQILIRVIKALRRNKVSNRVILAAWKSFKKSWRFINKSFNKINFKYIQSSEDIMGTINKAKKLSEMTNNVKIFEKGYHILSFDVNSADKLFDEIARFIH